MTASVNKQSSPTESLHVRVPQGKLENIDHIAMSIGRSRNWVLNEALNHYLDVQKWQTDLIKERVQEASHKNTLFFSHDKVMKRYEKRLKKKLGK